MGTGVSGCLLSTYSIGIRRATGIIGSRLDIGDLSTGKGKEQEHGGADKLAHTRDEMVLDIRIHPVQPGEAEDLGLLLLGEAAPVDLVRVRTP